MKNQNKNSYFLLLFLILFFPSCALKTSGLKSSTKAVYLDPETAQKVENILDQVAVKAATRNIDALGSSTLTETVKILDMGSGAAPVLTTRLKTSSDWKLRYWIVDILGYIASRGNIITLVEVIEDNSEKISIRLRACESLKELGYSESISHLNISKKLIKDIRLRDKVIETIYYLK